MSADFEGTLGPLKALADESRLKILGLLAGKEHSVEELANLLGLKAPTLFHHLSRLREAELVSMRSDGNTHLYRFDEQSLDAIRKHLGSKSRVASLAGGIEMEGWEEKVLRNFVDGEKLIRIPATHKKRQVILRWLVEFFEEDAVYAEKEINAELKRHHPDCATLRREFIAFKLMARERAMYWRLPLPQPPETP